MSQIVARDGVFYVSADIMAALARATVPVATIGGVRFVASPLMPPDRWAMVAPLTEDMQGPEKYGTQYGTENHSTPHDSL